MRSKIQRRSLRYVNKIYLGFAEQWLMQVTSIWYGLYKNLYETIAKPTYLWGKVGVVGISSFR